MSRSSSTRTSCTKEVGPPTTVAQSGSTANITTCTVSMKGSANKVNIPGSVLRRGRMPDLMDIQNDENWEKIIKPHFETAQKESDTVLRQVVISQCSITPVDSTHVITERILAKVRQALQRQIEFRSLSDQLLTMKSTTRPHAQSDPIQLRRKIETSTTQTTEVKTPNSHNSTPPKPDAALQVNQSTQQTAKQVKRDSLGFVEQHVYANANPGPTIRCTMYGSLGSIEQHICTNTEEAATNKGKLDGMIGLDDQYIYNNPDAAPTNTVRNHGTLGLDEQNIYANICAVPNNMDKMYGTLGFEDQNVYGDTTAAPDNTDGLYDTLNFGEWYIYATTGTAVKKKVRKKSRDTVEINGQTPGSPKLASESDATISINNPVSQTPIAKGHEKSLNKEALTSQGNPIFDIRFSTLGPSGVQDMTDRELSNTSNNVIHAPQNVLETEQRMYNMGVLNEVGIIQAICPRRRRRKRRFPVIVRIPSFISLREMSAQTQNTQTLPVIQSIKPGIKKVFWKYRERDDKNSWGKQGKNTERTKHRASLNKTLTKDNINENTDKPRNKTRPEEIFSYFKWRTEVKGDHIAQTTEHLTVTQSQENNEEKTKVSPDPYAAIQKTGAKRILTPKSTQQSSDSERQGSYDEPPQLPPRLYISV